MNSASGAPCAVIFDFDGTLVDTFPAIHAAWNAAMHPIYGRDFSRDEVIARFGPPDEGMLAHQLAEFEPQTLTDAVEIYYAKYEAMHSEISAFDGIDELLQALEQQGVPLAIMTGKGRRAAHISLRHLGWEDRFSVVVTGTEVPNAKPSPDGPLLAAQMLGAEPADCFYIGDSPADIGAARAAGMRGVVAGWHAYFLPKLREMQPRLWADSPLDVVQIYHSCR